MNDKAKKIISQVDKHMSDNFPGWDHYDLIDKWKDKFAEIIIEKTATHAAEIANYMEDTDQDEIGPAILAYFGLKNV